MEKDLKANEGVLSKNRSDIVSNKNLREKGIKKIYIFI